MLQSGSDDGGGEVSGPWALYVIQPSIHRRVPVPAAAGRFNQTQAQPVQRGRVRPVARSAIETGAGRRHRHRCRKYFVSATIEKYKTRKERKVTPALPVH